MSPIDVERAICPRCGGKRWMTVQLELCEQACREGEWETTWIIGTDTSWICRVTCEGCGHVLYDTESELTDALDEIRSSLHVQASVKVR
jgi:hypothetical protein